MAEAGSTNLEGFRGPEPVEGIEPQERIAPPPVVDNPDPAPVSTIVREQPAPAPAEQEEPPEPKLIIDPRAAMAARFNQRRAAEHAASQNIDPLSAPVDAAAPGDPAAEVQPAAQEPPPAAAPQTYVLKVNRQEFNATRADLLAAAEMTEAEADGAPDAALIRIAQKNLAAQARLDEIKQLSQTARLTGRAAVEPQAEEPFQAQREQPAPATPQADEAELFQQLQLGDTEDARKAFDELYNRRDQQRQTSQRLQQLQGDVNAAIENIGRNNPDIAASEHAADFLRTVAVREAVSELRKIGLSEAECQTLMNSPELATRAYNGARFQRLGVVEPDALFERAVATTRRVLNMPGGQPAPQPNPPPPAVSPRVEMKRALPTPPARSGTTDVNIRPNQPVQQQRDPSAVIAQMRKSRFQD